MHQSKRKLVAIQSSWLLVLAVAMSVFVAFGALYLATAIWQERTESPPTAYFDLLAESFLQGRLYLVNPISQLDLTQHAGQWYVPFPPLPALLLLPWVAISGVANVNTVLFSIVIGAANVTLAFLLLQALARRGWSELKLADNLWLTVLLGAGCVHWYMSTLGSVWFMAQICTLTFMLAAVWLAVASGNALLSGAALAIAMLGRPNVVLLFPLLVSIGARHHADQSGKRSWVTWALLAFAPLCIAGGLLLAYNNARFGNWLDFGYLNQNVSRDLASDLRRYGQFNQHYILHNLWSMLLAGPVWDAQRGMFLPTVEGMSLLLTTPALIFLFRERPRSIVAIGAWVALGLLLIPLLTYYNTGWWQFGYRFSLDFMVAVLVLLAITAGPRLGWRMRLLIVLGVVVNTWGSWWFANPANVPWNF